MSPNGAVIITSKPILMEKNPLKPYFFAFPVCSLYQISHTLQRGILH